MSIVAAFCPLSLQSLLDGNGEPIVGGKLAAFDAGTTASRSLYRDAGLTTPYPVPVLTDGNGRFPPIFVGVGSYKLVIQNAAGSQISVIDGLQGGFDNSVAPPVVGTVIPTGFVMPAHTADVANGWLPLNGKTIGSATSLASALADPTAQPLFITLWNNDASLTVSSGRGISASADWTAGKTIALPDYRGRIFCGRDAMGSSFANRITAASIPTGSSDAIGNSFGSETVVLSVGGMPSHQHAITVNPGGGFTPAGSVTAAGGFTPAGSVGQGGDHFHNVTYTVINANGTTARNVVPFAAGGNQVQTDNSGTHNHSFTGTPQPDHTHPFVGTAQPDHSHTATSSNIGGGSAHANMPPVILGTWQIKL